MGEPSILEMGLSHLASYLHEQTRHTVATFDQTYHWRSWRGPLFRALDESRPDAIGFACNSMNQAAIRDIVAAIRERLSVPVILGGYHPTLSPREALAIPGVNAICIGEGEIALGRYLDALENGTPPEAIPGIWCKYGDDVREGPPSELLPDFDAMPTPDYTIWKDIDKFLRFNGSMYFISQRMCAFKCSYCAAEAYRKTVRDRPKRRRSPERFVEDIRVTYEIFGPRGMRIAHLFDPVFTIDAKWLGRFAEAYEREPWSRHVPLSVFSRPDALDAERIEMLARANCETVRIGVETGDEEVREKAYLKPVSNDAYRETCGMLRKKGIKVTGYYILGGPADTWDSLKKTWSLNRELKIDRPFFFMFRPFPGTRAWDMVTQLGGAFASGHEEIANLHSQPSIRAAGVPAWKVSNFRRACILVFTGGRVLRLIRTQRLRFFRDLAAYAWHAFREGMRLEFIVGYGLHSAGDNLHM